MCVCVCVNDFNNGSCNLYSFMEFEYIKNAIPLEFSEFSLKKKIENLVKLSKFHYDWTKNRQQQQAIPIILIPFPSPSTNAKI